MNLILKDDSLTGCLAVSLEQQINPCVGLKGKVVLQWRRRRRRGVAGAATQQHSVALLGRGGGRGPGPGEGLLSDRLSLQGPHRGSQAVPVQHSPAGPGARGPTTNLAVQDRPSCNWLGTERRSCHVKLVEGRGSKLPRSHPGSGFTPRRRPFQSRAVPGWGPCHPQCEQP